MQNNNLSHLNVATEQLAQQVLIILAQLKNEQFQASLKLLSGNSIGKHARHIIEFFEELLKGSTHGALNYDTRKRNVLLETNLDQTIKTLRHIFTQLETVHTDSLVELKANFLVGTDEVITIQSSFSREWAYNIEHAVHHLAIIKMAILHHFPMINIPENLGVAASTQHYQNNQ